MASVEAEESTPFDKMKLNLAKNKVSGEDIDNIVAEARYGRRPVEIMTNNITYKIFGWFQKCWGAICPCCV